MWRYPMGCYFGIMLKRTVYFNRIIIFSLLIASCQSKTATNDSTEQAILSSNPYTVYVTYSNDCPFCIRYTQTLREIRDSLPLNWGFKLLKVNSKENWDFDWSVSISNDMVDDEDRVYCNLFDLDVYPEAVIADSSGRVLYKGAIDDRAHAIGLSKPKLRHSYLKDAIIAVETGETVNPKKTKAVGCFIEP